MRALRKGLGRIMKKLIVCSCVLAALSSCGRTTGHRVRSTSTWHVSPDIGTSLAYMVATRFATMVVARESCYLSNEELLGLAGTITKFGPMFRCRDSSNEFQRFYDIVGYAELEDAESNHHVALDCQELSEDWGSVCSKLKEGLESLGPEAADPAVFRAAIYLVARDRPHEEFIRLVLVARESIAPDNAFRIRCVSASPVAAGKVRLVEKNPGPPQAAE